MLDPNIKRGTIYDSDDNVLAKSSNSSDGFQRTYSAGREFVHVIGNVMYQKTGVEAKYSLTLQQLHFDLIQRVEKYLTDRELEGNNLHLTIDQDFQKYVFEQLGANKGAIVCIEPSTGKILAMVSYPNYDANTIAENYTSLLADTENSPLLNRASKGLYPPGSVFKIVSSLQIMRNISDYEDYYYECKGEDTFDGQTIRCANKTAHGNVNLSKAFTVSCNTYFSYMSMKLDNDGFKKLAEELYFNKDYPYPLEHSQSSYVLNNSSSTQERIQTSIGQGKTSMTPLHIAMLTSAVANGGILMEPYILDYIETRGGAQKDKTIPKMMGSIMTSDEAAKLNAMMWDVVSYGTGRPSAVSGVEISGKTGTAQNSTPNDHSLYTAFSPSENPEIVVTVVLEEAGAGGGAKSLSMAKNIFQYYLK